LMILSIVGYGSYPCAISVYVSAFDFDFVRSLV
jgi:hypothetical protein